MGYGMAVQEQFEIDKIAAAKAVEQVLRGIEGAALQQSDTAFSPDGQHLIMIPINMETMVNISMHDVALTDNLRKLVATEVIGQLMGLHALIHDEIQAFEASLE